MFDQLCCIQWRIGDWITFQFFVHGRPLWLEKSLEKAIVRIRKFCRLRRQVFGEFGFNSEDTILTCKQHIQCRWSAFEACRAFGLEP